MSWFQSLRDDFTLRPCETQQAPSDSVAMASGPSDAAASQEPVEVAEECSAKKKSKFQAFKKFFARKKRKEPSASGGEAGLKASQSSDNVSKTPENNTLTRSEKDKGSGSKISLGSKALSHDSVFVSDSSETNEALGASQDSIHGKVKSLQLQLKQAIKLGSPPSLMCVKKTEDAGAMSEDDGLPCSPPEYSSRHAAQNQAQRSSISLEGTDSDEEQLPCAASSRAVSPLVVAPCDFSQPATHVSCLDNSAAKHKLGLRHKACNKRKPARRLELRTGGDSSVEEMLSTSIPEALEERREQEVGDDQLKPKKEEGEEGEPQEHSRQSLLSDKEEREEGEDEQEAEQEVPHDSQMSSPPPETRPSEGDAPDTPSSRSSSLDSPRASPEPPAAQREYLLDPPGIAYGTDEDRVETDSALAVQEEEEEELLTITEGNIMEEESSFLEEVLNSLTPLSLGLETEGVVLDMKTEEEVKKREVEEQEDVEEEEGEGEEVKEAVAEADEPISHQIASPVSPLSDQSTQEEDDEEEEDLNWTTSSCKAEEKEEEEEPEVKNEEEAEEEEEEDKPLLVQQEEEEEKHEAEEVKGQEENDVPLAKTDVVEKQNVVEEHMDEDEITVEVVAVELEKTPDVDEEGQEVKGMHDEEVEEKGREEEEEEGDDTEETAEKFPDGTKEGFQSEVAVQEAEEEQEEEDTAGTLQNTDESQSSAEPCDLIVPSCELQTSNQNSEEERNDEEEETTEEVAEIEHVEVKSEGDKDNDANQSDPEQDGGDEAGVELDLDQPGSEMLHQDQTGVDPAGTKQDSVCIRPSSISLPETQMQDSETSSPTSQISPSSNTTTLHINLVSPSLEKARAAFELPPSTVDPTEEPREEPSHADLEQNPADEEPEEDSAGGEQGTPSSEAAATQEEKAEETIIQLSSPSDQNKARFTIAPVMHRLLTAGDNKEYVLPRSPSPPPASISSVSPPPPSPSIAGPEVVAEVEATPKPVPRVKAETPSSSPDRAKNAGASPAKPQSNATTPSGKPQASAAAATEESSVLVEGNPDNPFGVRLRRTSALHRSSEEENTECVHKPPAQLPSAKVDSQQPFSVKSPVSQPIIKPALPKKPDIHGDAAGKPKQIPDPAAVRGGSGGSDSPSWISVAKQKQRLYKENSLDEITAKKEDQERKSSLPLFVSKTPESKVSPVDITKSAAPVEKETRRAFSPPTPVPAQPTKTPSLPCPVAPKPHVTSAPKPHVTSAPKPRVTSAPATPKKQPQPNPSPQTPLPVPQRSPCTSPPSVSKPALPPSSKSPQPQSSPLSIQRPPQSSQTQSAQRGLAPDLPQDEPPWMALAKKKAKAWSEMPQIVQ
ncbi:uncharacterized protein LOC142992900 isoform X2 [Genypterus blacodes]|uniref:uncharacterized protein LOC142992900 isoform X2 n=1 Tax=Genypterus blacodes TaxID=154954 RepID=UPI003F76E7FD